MGDKQLDWSRPKGTIMGPPPVGNAKFEQNGMYFNASGEFVAMAGGQNPVVQEVPEPAPVEAEAKEEPEALSPDKDVANDGDDTILAKPEKADTAKPKAVTKQEVLEKYVNGYSPTEIAEHFTGQGRTISRQKAQAWIRRSKFDKA